MNSTSVVLYAWGSHKTTFDTKLVQVLELPGVCSNVSVVEEVQKATGIEVETARCRFIGTRQSLPTKALHITVFAILLTAEEVGSRVVRRVGDILSQPDVPWAKVGVIMTALLCHQVEPIPAKRKRKS